LQAKKSILPLADRGPAAQKPLLAKPSGRGRERDPDRARPVSGGWRGICFQRSWPRV